VLTAAVCVALSGAGLAVAVLTAWRRRYRRAVRVAAVALLPVGLYMAGLVPLGTKIGEAFGTWAAGLVFKSTVWAGFAVIALAVLLHLGSRIGRARSEAKVDRGADRGAAVAPASSAPAIAPAPSAPEAAGRKRGKGADATSEFDDIEAILRKHNI
jgi:hypothetical protein